MSDDQLPEFVTMELTKAVIQEIMGKSAATMRKVLEAKMKELNVESISEVVKKMDADETLQQSVMEAYMTTLDGYRQEILTKYKIDKAVGREREKVRCRSCRLRLWCIRTIPSSRRRLWISQLSSRRNSDKSVCRCKRGACFDCFIAVCLLKTEKSYKKTDYALRFLFIPWISRVSSSCCEAKKLKICSSVIWAIEYSSIVHFFLISSMKLKIAESFIPLVSTRSVTILP